MDLNVELGSYWAEQGLRLAWVPGYALCVTVSAQEVVIGGNEQGPRSLAQHLLTLADKQYRLGLTPTWSRV
jgi:hypothetical protein